MNLAKLLCFTNLDFPETLKLRGFPFPFQKAGFWGETGGEVAMKFETLLLMVQKAGGFPPWMVLKPVVNNGTNQAQLVIARISAMNRMEKWIWSSILVWFPCHIVAMPLKIHHPPTLLPPWYRGNGHGCPGWWGRTGHSTTHREDQDEGTEAYKYPNPETNSKLGVSKIGVPQNGWFIMENNKKMDDLGVPLFLETPS